MNVPLRLKLRWLLVLGLCSLPYAVLLVGGLLWLEQRGWIWYWMAGAAVLMLAGWVAVRRFRARFHQPGKSTVQPDDRWPPAGREAWRHVEVIARRVEEQEDVPLEPEPLWRLLHEVLHAVARQYHPKSKRPELEIPVPHVLKVSELVAADLREAFSERVPGAHIVTLHDMQRLGRFATFIKRQYDWFRVAAFALNPLSGLLREIRNKAAGGLAGASTEEIKRWALGFAVRKAGYYAIQLYSGQLVLDELDFEAHRTRQTQRDVESSRKQSDDLAAEPLRILVLGQVKAGKSSLINALFGEVRAAVDVVPSTRGVEPFVLKRDGLPQAIVLDTAGYDAVGAADGPFQHYRDEIVQSDLVLLACSAQSAARAADRRLLDGMRAFYQGQPHRIMPPVVVAMSHVDQLRPLHEWDPPYDLTDVGNVKAGNIRAAAAAVAEGLALSADQPVVPVCLLPDRLYNVEEALAPAILAAIPEAQRVRYLRCLGSYRRRSFWDKLRQQAASTGRLLLKAGARWAGQSATKPPT